MFITLLITACVAAMTAGVVLLAYRAFGQRPPKAVLLTAVGLSILAYVTYSRYTWADLMIARLPNTIEVIQSYRESAVYEPWTFIWPRITHFAAIDRATLAAHRSLPGVYLVEMILVGEGDPSLSVPQVIDCIGGRRANLTPDAPLDPGVLADTLDWQTGRSPERLFERVCAE